MDLIIVESPSKAKTISKYLKGKYKVDASGGHIRDLPEKVMGIRMEDFEPRYEITESKRDIIERLESEVKKADKVYLATDPDREGEAISWHLQCVLGLDADAEDRIEFNEISQRAVERALEHPRKINPNLVNAQQARRVLDRLVGYRLSPLLDKKLESGGTHLSAGRVQSVALKLIVDREREIGAFKPEQYWGFTADLSASGGKSDSFKATYLLKKNGRDVSEEEASDLYSRLKADEYVVKKIKKSTVRQHAPAPFTTSSLQQDASNKLGMSAPETMMVAQHLYEGMEVGGDHVAFITYLRTDSTRISEEAQREAAAYISATYGKEFCPAKPNVYTTKKNIQDAHEAIRPISLDMTLAKAKKLLDLKHYRVYELVYNRFVASQMADAVYDSTQVEVEAVAEKCVFRASGRIPKFLGYTAVYSDMNPDDEDDEAKRLFPKMAEGDRLDLNDLAKDRKLTQPPKRYTDASLVKTMDEKGIGRPSTYSSIIKVLTSRGYVKKDGKSMVPTDVAYRMTDLLSKYFDDIMDINFTAKMEEDLDRIEDGGTEWKAIIREFYPGFESRLKVASSDGDEMTDIKCEKCGRPMIRRTGKYGKYLACSGFPACKNIVGEDEEEYSEVPCPRCGSKMAIKGGRYGKYLICVNVSCGQKLSIDAEVVENEKCDACGGTMVIKSGPYGRYKECLDCKKRVPMRGGRTKGASSGDETEQNTAGKCPECGRSMRYMRSKKGRTYLSCTGYPDCKFMSWDTPTGDKCPVCGNYLVIRGGKVCCSDRKCEYTEGVKN